MTDSNRKVTIAALIGWAVLGQIGGFVSAGPQQNVVWALSTVGMLIASPLLMIRFAREGRDLVAAGHAVLSVSAIVMYAGGPISSPGGQVSFAAAIFFYAPALVLIGSGPGHPIAARVLGSISALAFFAFGVLVLAGVTPSPALKMVVNAGGYVFMTAAVIGWTVGLVRMPKTQPVVAVSSHAAPARS